MIDNLTRLRRAYDRAEERSRAAAARRAALPAGSSRARVTTANARWMRAAEELDRALAELRAAEGPTSPPSRGEP